MRAERLPARGGAGAAADEEFDPLLPVPGDEAQRVRAGRWRGGCATAGKEEAELRNRREPLPCLAFKRKRLCVSALAFVVNPSVGRCRNDPPTRGNAPVFKFTKRQRRAKTAVRFGSANSTTSLPPRQDRFRFGSNRTVAACRCSDPSFRWPVGRGEARRRGALNPRYRLMR